MQAHDRKNPVYLQPFTQSMPASTAFILEQLRRGKTDDHPNRNRAKLAVAHCHLFRNLAVSRCHFFQKLAVSHCHFFRNLAVPHGLFAQNGN